MSELPRTSRHDPPQVSSIRCAHGRDTAAWLASDDERPQAQFAGRARRSCPRRSRPCRGRSSAPCRRPSRRARVRRPAVARRRPRRRSARRRAGRRSICTTGTPPVKPLLIDHACRTRRRGGCRRRAAPCPELAPTFQIGGGQREVGRRPRRPRGRLDLRDVADRDAEVRAQRRVGREAGAHVALVGERDAPQIVPGPRGESIADAGGVQAAAVERRPPAQRVQLTGEQLELARERVGPRLALDGVGRRRARAAAG